LEISLSSYTGHPCKILRSYTEVKNNEMDKECSTHEEKRSTCRFLAVKSGGKRPLARPRRRWEDDIEMLLREIV
jgi:hypothetical protein